MTPDIQTMKERYDIPDIFTAEDFLNAFAGIEDVPLERLPVIGKICIHMADAANARLKEYVKGLPVVYAQTYEDGSSVYGWRDCKKIHCTHTAYLLFPRKIEP